MIKNFIGCFGWWSIIMIPLYVILIGATIVALGMTIIYVACSLGIIWGVLYVIEKVTGAKLL